jgi:hypothetical protein
MARKQLKKLGIEWKRGLTKPTQIEAEREGQDLNTTIRCVRSGNKD